MLIIILACRASVVPVNLQPKIDGSCAGRCGDNDSSFSCQCNTECANWSDCCSDYNTVCYTCKNRCGESYNYAAPCVCSDGCEPYHDCCDDYSSICSGNYNDFYLVYEK